PASRTAAPAAAQASLVVTPVLGEILRTAGRALRVNFVRTLLTLLGVVIGVASVVSMLAIGNGAKRAVLDQINAMGPDLLVIRPGARNLRVAGGTIATLTDVDRAAVGRLPGVRAAISEYPVNVTARFAGSDVTTSADATQPNLPDLRMWP